MMLRKMCIALLVLTLCLGAGCGSNQGSDTKNIIQNQQTGTEQENTAQNGTESVQESTTESISQVVAESTESSDAEPIYPDITSDEEVKDYGSVVVVGDAAYELYTYLEDEADKYAKTVNKVAKNLEGEADVYDIVIPLGSGVIFPDNLSDQIASSDQKEAVQKIFDKMDASVKCVDIYGSLMEHRDEYIYFRTDHHWTALGAYYAYEDFCEVKGIEPETLDGYETKEFDGFLGSFYNDTNQAAELGDHPDTVIAYVPNMDAVCHVTDSRGVEYDSSVIYDETNAAADLKYSAFIAGDNPYTVIENKELSDGSSCIVVKESFGNAFVPFLVDHYETIYVVDYRYWTGSICDLTEEKGVSDVIFINNLSMIRNKNLVGKLYRII